MHYLTLLKCFQAGLKSKVYPLTVDEYEPDTFEAVKHRINQRFTNGGSKLVKIDLSDTDQVIISNTKVMYKHFVQCVLYFT